MKVLLLFSAAFFVTACTPTSFTPPTSQSISPTPPLTAQLATTGSVDSEHLQDFLVQQVQHVQPGYIPRLVQWWLKERLQGLKKSPDLRIDNVLLIENGLSVMGNQAPTAIIPDYAGKSLRLKLQGKFLNRQRKPIPLSEFLFSLETPLVQQTFLGTTPTARVLLDDSILLQTVSATENEIEVQLETKYLPDLYLKGQHKLTVELDTFYTDTLVQVGDPAPVSNLQPTITTIDVITSPQGKATHIHLTGSNFMVYPKFAHATIDGKFGFGYQTEVLANGTFEAKIHIPDPATFNLQTSHTLVYATPFGTVFRQFGGAQ